MNRHEDVTGRTREHYVNPEPFDPLSREVITPEQERFYQASQLHIMWWKFKHHKLAIWAGVILFLFYLAVPFAEQIAPYSPNKRHVEYLYAPPQGIHLFHEGRFVGPFVYGMKSSLKNGIENLLKYYVPEVVEVRSIS